MLEVPRPRNNNWARYQNLDLVIPEEVCLMIENGIQRWASKLCPKIDVEENKNIHLETVKKTIKIDTLRDCIIIGIVYYIGARPVQIGKLSGGDFIVDTENKYGMRYSVLVPYAKKSKLTIDRVRVAIPEELGKLILLYKYLVGIGLRLLIIHFNKAMNSRKDLKFNRVVKKRGQSRDRPLPSCADKLH